MLANKTISIIIPIYNGQEFIKSTFNNLLDYKNKLFEYNINIEIIAILDDCNDASEAELVKFQDKLKLKLQKNFAKKGPSYCRNLGVLHANGDYILFLDIDDTLVLHKLNQLSEDLNIDSDILIGDYYIKRGNNVELRCHSMPNDMKNNFLSKEFIENYLIKYTLEPYVYTLFVHCWCKFYSTKFLKKNNIRFNEQIDQLEDTNFNLKCLIYLPKVFYLNKPIYCYTANSGPNNLSKQSGGNKNNIKNVIRALHIIKNVLPNIDAITNRYYRYHLYATLFVLWMIRASREPKNIVKIYKIFVAYCKDKSVIYSMKYYIRLKSNDGIIPLMVKFKLPLLALIYCKLAK